MFFVVYYFYIYYFARRTLLFSQYGYVLAKFAKCWTILSNSNVLPIFACISTVWKNLNSYARCCTYSDRPLVKLRPAVNQPIDQSSRHDSNPSINYSYSAVSLLTSKLLHTSIFIMYFNLRKGSFFIPTCSMHKTNLSINRASNQAINQSV